MDAKTRESNFHRKGRKDRKEESAANKDSTINSQPKQKAPLIAAPF
jgi:hypothetical protein